jgi:parallel beta-helix repeat protein
MDPAGRTFGAGSPSPALGVTCILCGNATMSPRRRTIHVSISRGRVFGSAVVLTAIIGAGTIGAAVLSLAPAAAAQVITVNDASDPVSQVPASNCNPSSETDCTLRAALAEATSLNGDVTISLHNPDTVPNNPGPYYSVDPSNSRLDITDTGGTVTLLGDGAPVVDIRAGCPTSCGTDTRVLELGSSDLGGVVAHISGVTISNGDAPSGEGSDCGGICVSSPGSKLTLTDSKVSGNTATTFGGGIGLYDGGSATLIGDTISSNTAVSGGGGIYVVSNDTTTVSNLTMQDTTVSGNQVDAGDGGGIDVFNTSGAGLDGNVTIDIDHSTINGNEITGVGGAGSGIASSDGNWAVTDSTISGNTEASGMSVDGGGAYISNSPLTSKWRFDTLAGNSAGSGGHGGNLDMQGGTLNLGESIVAGGLSGNAQDNCSMGGGMLLSAGYNLIDDTTCGTPATGDIVGRSPNLGTLGNNGGFTSTQLPASSSPAVGAVPASVTSGTGVSTDQRGAARGQGAYGSSTIGSVEVAQATPTTTTTTSPSSTPPPTHGYWLVGSDGGIFSFGSAQFHGSTGNITLQRPVVGVSPTANEAGYWLVGSDGGVFAFGNAGYYGSIPGAGLAPAGSGLPHSLNAPIVGIVPSSDGRGYFMVASDGGVFAFGDARFAGSCPGVGGCAGAAAAVVPDASGNGYWLITQTGNVYAFGDAPYDGAPGNQGFPVTSAVRTVDGGGYWVLLADGAVFAYGDAVTYGGPVGSLGPLNKASAIFPDADGGGYWVAAADGAVFSYGDATNEGSMVGNPLNGSIIAATGF